MTRYICIHGHFYQPPRENPWLEAVEIQDSARPYHDWNERITAECYAPNSASRILDGENRILDIVGNYSRISFDFGPSLLSWLEAYSSDVYQAILDADRESVVTKSGHGNAIAQVYNHVIMPLADTRDKRTQVAWGLKDFTHRFNRLPEGMWLAETAVDTETLEILAEAGIKFTILAPHQVPSGEKRRGRRMGECNGGEGRYHHALSCQPPFGQKHKRVLLQRGNFQGSGIRQSSRPWRQFRKSSPRRFLGQGTRGADRKHCLRWRNIRPSSQIRGHGAGLCNQPSGAGGGWPPRRITGRSSRNIRRTSRSG